MTDDLPERSLVTRPQDSLAAVVVDSRAPGGLELAVHDALRAAGLRRDMVAIVLVPVGASQSSWAPRLPDYGASETAEGLVVDSLGHAVHLNGRLVQLTVREFALLHYLYERRGTVLTREDLLRDVWGESYGGGPRTVDIHIRRLRAKLGADWFETTRGVGYKFRRRA